MVENPVRACLYTYLAEKRAQGLKPRFLLACNGPTKVVP
jgi:hypothetical protein